MRKKKNEVEIVITKKHLMFIFTILSIGIGITFYYWILFSAQRECQNKGNIWCNGNCYLPCPAGEKFNCPQEGEASCIPTYNIEDLKKSIVHISYTAMSCCDSTGEISEIGASGSGVIYSKENNKVRVLTSRHVVDCVFAKSCLYPKNEQIKITTWNGKSYTPTLVEYAPYGLDLAILDFQTTDININPVTLNLEKYSIGDKVVAIGYPTFEVESSEPILELLISEGNITEIHNLLTFHDYSFIGITSNAVTGEGASGGGLFNQKGQLIGIITWGNKTQSLTTAIDVNSLPAVFFVCPSGNYPTNKYDKYGVEENEICCPYGTILNIDDKKCYEPCEKPYSYCPSPNICCNNKCYKPCPSDEILGEDCICHPKCGNGYCPLGYECCNNQCIKCEVGYYLGTDCLCHPYFISNLPLFP